MPACKLCIAYIIGIAISDCCNFSFSNIQMITAYVCLVTCSLFSENLSNPVKKSCFWFCAFILFGFFFNSESKHLPANHFSIYESPSQLIGTVIHHKAQNKSDQYHLVIDSVLTETRRQASSGKLKVSVYPTSVEPIKEGAQILIPANYAEIKKNTNPHTFDYKSFMSRSAIYHSLAVHQNEVKIRSNVRNRTFYYYLGILRSQIKQVFSEYIKEPTAHHVLLALTLGEKSSQIDHIKKDYIKTGTVHVLAISGLHVGTIAAIFILLLKRVSRKRKTQRLLIILIAVLTVWLFACLSGLSQSVSRAALMFSLMICSQFISHKVRVLNIVGLSALILLYIDPNNLYSISFQFSFLAVISILLFYRPIRNLFPGFAGVRKYMLDLFAVSCAAQILITPLSIYYFNQFSIVGVFLSVLIVPLTAVILQSALLGLLCVSINLFLGEYLLLFSEKLITVQNTVVEFCAQFPICHLDDLWMHWSMVFIIYVFILGIILFKRHYQNLVLWLLFSWLFSTSLYFLKNEDKSFYLQKYDVLPYYVQDLVIDDYLITVSSDETPQSVIDFNVKRNRLSLEYNHVLNIKSSELLNADIVCCFSNKSLCISNNLPRCLGAYDLVWSVDKAVIYSERESKMPISKPDDIYKR